MDIIQKTGSELLSTILGEMNEEGNFQMSLLTDGEGLAMASGVANEGDPDRQSAVIAILQKTVTQTSRQLGLNEVEDISIQFADGRHLICRPFTVANNRFILAIVLNSRQQSYRRTANQALSRIRQLWKNL